MRLQQIIVTAMRNIVVSCIISMTCMLFGGQVLPASAASTAFVRIIHAAPGVGTADIFVDGTKLLSNFQFATVTSYVPIPAGAHKVQIAVIGKGVNASALTQTLSVDAGTAYTVAALGATSTNLSLQVFKDDNTVTGNMAKVRIYHCAPGALSADVSLNTNPVVQGLSYQQASPYLSLSPGSYKFNATIMPANITIPVSTTLKLWTVTSIFAVGTLNGSPALQFVSSQEAGIPGMPQTGSDPTPLPDSSQQQVPWLAVLLVSSALALLAIVPRATKRRVRSFFKQ